MKKNLIVRQEYSKECGSACLLSIIRYYGGDATINSLVELTKTDKDGTNFYNMTIASHKMGLDSKCYKIEKIDNLYQIDRPFITQMVFNNYAHFVVVYRVARDKITIMDPGRGNVSMDIKSFLNNWTGYVMLFSPYRKLSIVKKNDYLKQTILTVILDNKKIIINILFLSIFFAMMTCIYSFYLNVIIDKVIGTNIINLVLISTIFGIVAITKNLADYSRYELLIYLNQKLDLSIIINTFNKILLLPYNYYKNKTTGEVISRINDLVCIRNLLSKIIITIFLDLIITISSSIILFNISKTMFLCLIVIVVTYIIIFIIFKPLVVKLTKINQENNAILNSFLVENITGFETIKGLHIESVVKKKFSGLYSNSLNYNLKYEKTNNLEILLKNLISSIGYVILIFIGIKEINNGYMSLGLFITFYSLSSYFLEPIKNMIDLNRDYFYAKSSVKRINDLLEVESVKFLSNNLPVNGDISINNLSFSYNNHDMILGDINLNIKNKEKVLILGSSGSGKSTLLKILYKYYNVPRNQVIINNYDINDYLLEDIRGSVSYISQNEILYTNTIKNNILLERDIDYEKFIKICNLTCTDDVVKDKFLGYDTMLEENGSNISGGERQRIILARTLLKNNSVLLIDEGFSEIDINTERKILKNIFDNFKDMTILIVSHRLENMDLYDKVIKLNNGKIIDVSSKEVRYG